MAIRYDVWVSKDFEDAFEFFLVNHFDMKPNTVLSYSAVDELPDADVDEHELL